MKKIGDGLQQLFFWILLIISLWVAYELAYFFTKLIPAPIVIGGLFGYFFGWALNRK
jgi:hypothetical protein